MVWVRVGGQPDVRQDAAPSSCPDATSRSSDSGENREADGYKTTISASAASNNASGTNLRANPSSWRQIRAVCLGGLRPTGLKGAAQHCPESAPQSSHVGEHREPDPPSTTQSVASAFAGCTGSRPNASSVRPPPAECLGTPPGRQRQRRVPHIVGNANALPSRLPLRTRGLPRRPRPIQCALIQGTNDLIHP